MAKIGIFGGTFNPPHIGHLIAAEEAKNALGLDKVLFLPDAQPPHKSMPHGSPDGQTRLALLEAALKDVPWAEADGMELEREGKSYTADTLTILRRRFPEDKLYLLSLIHI